MPYKAIFCSLSTISSPKKVASCISEIKLVRSVIDIHWHDVPKKNIFK